VIPSQEAWRIFKGRQEPTVFVTAYDAAFARLAESAGAAGVIVGDTVGPLALGLASVEDVGIEMMRHHAAAVRRGVEHIPVMADVPLGIISGDETTAVETSRRLAEDADVHALKIEGVTPHVLRIVERLADAGLAVSAHIEGDGNRDGTLMDHASRLVDAGVVCIVLFSMYS
jgi:3-methyl-2-oxobutanoate hydroxymethyltransferase